jgi:molybdopterin molybdotransferase
MSDLRSVDDALADILRHIHQLEAEAVSLPQSLERVLAADIISDINLPPFANSAVDGFALKAADSQGATKENPAVLKVIMDIPAGSTPQHAIQTGEAARIMTGAPVPDGADTTIPVEDTNADFSKLDHAPFPEEVALFRAASVGDNVRLIGENIKIGETILTAGTTIQPADIGVLASIGKATVSVMRRPRVAIIGTGDELVAVNEPLTSGKIRDSNSYTLQALVTQDGGDAIRLPIAPDNADVSMGAADYVRTILDEMGAINFWKINMRPGKPVAFGHLGKVPFFGLPGNPVSAMVTYDVLVRPALLKLAGKTDSAHYVTAVAGETMYSDGRRTYARVTLSRDNGQLLAYVTGTQSSGALISMVKADGLLIIPEDVREVPSGTPLKVRLLRPVE